MGKLGCYPAVSDPASLRNGHWGSSNPAFTMPTGPRPAHDQAGFVVSCLCEHATFPSAFRRRVGTPRQVGSLAQGYHAQPLPCCTGIKLRRDAAHQNRRLRLLLNRGDALHLHFKITRCSSYRYDFMSQQRFVRHVLNLGCRLPRYRPQPDSPDDSRKAALARPRPASTTSTG
jgi:hypothetical protein